MSAEREAELKSLAVEVLKYWETRRVFYNLLLLAVTVRDFHHDGALGMLTETRVLLILTASAAGANLLYCAAHLVDFAVQLSSLRRFWLRVRWLLLLAGCWLASAIAYQQTGWLTGGERMI